MTCVGGATAEVNQSMLAAGESPLRCLLVATIHEEDFDDACYKSQFTFLLARKYCESPLPAGGEHA